MNLEMLYKALNNNFTDSLTICQSPETVLLMAEPWTVWEPSDPRGTGHPQIQRTNRVLPYHKPLRPYILQKQTQARRAQGGSKGQRVCSSPQMSVMFPLGSFPLVSVLVHWQSPCKSSYGTVVLLIPLFSAKVAKWEEWYQKWHMVHLYCVLSFIHSK